MHITDGESYAKIEIAEGKVIVFQIDKSLNVALSNGAFEEHDSIKALLEIYPKYKLIQSWDSLSIGEEIERAGEKWGILSANGYGDSRVVLTSCYENKQKASVCWNTVKELKDEGCKIVPLEEKTEEMTVAQIAKELGREVKVVK